MNATIGGNGTLPKGAQVAAGGAGAASAFGAATCSVYAIDVETSARKAVIRECAELARNWARQDGSGYGGLALEKFATHLENLL